MNYLINIISTSLFNLIVRRQGMLTLKEAIINYLAYCEYQKKLSAKSIKAYTIDFKQLKQYSTSENIPTKVEIYAYITYLHKTYSPRTVKRKIASIRALLTYLEFEEIIPENPMKKMKIKFQIPQILPRTIPLVIIENILRAAYQELKQTQTSYALNTALRNVVMLELLFATGLRVSELCSLNVEYIDLDNGNILILGKGAKEHLLQIGNSEVLSILRRYAEKNAAQIREAGYFFIILHSIGKVT
jgi:integrase/recombinase XerD